MGAFGDIEDNLPRYHSRKVEGGTNEGQNTERIYLPER